jgi:hypothetical protein
VQNATEIQDFYGQVVGWTATPHNMGDYHDFDIKIPDQGQTVAGICRGRPN